MLVRLSVGDHQYALRLTQVTGVVHMVAVAPLPEAPREVVGAINLRGRVIPVVSLRVHLGLPERDPTLTDRIVIVDASGRTIGLLVDTVLDVVTADRVEVQDVAVDLAAGRAAAVATVDGASIPILELEMLSAPARTLPSVSHPAGGAL